MKKYGLVALLAVAMLVGYGVSTVRAQDAPPESVGVIITGVNYGLLATLSKEDLAGANAGFAQLNGLKVTEAKDVEGNEIADLVGKTLHYLPVKAAEPIMVGEQSQGKEIKIIGRLFKNESAILVEEFEADDADDWDDLPVGSMSGLQVL